VPWRRIGYVPQRVTASAGVPATALEVVRSGLLGPRNLWADRGPKAKRRAMEALRAVDLADRAQDHVQVFSGGQSQRVLIARALVRDPDLLVLDEPLAGIDRDSRTSLAGILASLRERGTTIVTVLHEMGELAELVERAVVLAEGRVVHDGPPPRPVPGHDRPGHDHVHPHESAEPAGHHAPSLRLDPRS
jgi:ABC transporter, ATP-binding protein